MRVIISLLITYLFLYPIIYFGFNFFINLAGYPAYVIPGFWIGMLGFALLMLVKNVFFGR